MISSYCRKKNKTQHSNEYIEYNNPTEEKKKEKPHILYTSIYLHSSGFNFFLCSENISKSVKNIFEFQINKEKKKKIKGHFVWH